MGQTWIVARQSWEIPQGREESQATGMAMVLASVWTPLLGPYGLSMLSMTSLSGDSTLALGLMGERTLPVQTAGLAAVAQHT